MARDIRELLKEQDEQTPKLSEGHLGRFEAKLEALHQEKIVVSKPWYKEQWLQVAAMIAVIVTVGLIGYQQFSTPSELSGEEITSTDENSDAAQIQLGDLSPDLKKVENYYMAGINMQLASLEINPDNKELVEGYMEQLKQLDQEYKTLTVELNEMGPTEATITALIENLQLRLDLLFKLKNKLKELKKADNEPLNII
ncbi:hypothetical protein [Luteirhabdus pelagi]|uniref:hypothetical protein n=1 Tax=Luteirhabdus pelagi TaxID=2792783 RepID=UPI00193A4C50|nr:hypothetical protein [Luteirhabdus pelagi]